MVDDILPAGDIVRIIANEAEAVLRHLSSLVNEAPQTQARTNLQRRNVG